MEKDLTKRYSNGQVIVVWQPDKCIHSGVCVRGLPLVFAPSRRPWIDLAPATSEQIVAQVAKCPSGALSIERPDSKI